jgi:hypothetical protein
VRTYGKVTAALLIFACVGCQHTEGGDASAGAAPVLPVTQLKDLIRTATAETFVTLDGRAVAVRARVELKYRAQQYLWLDDASADEDPSEHCLQLVIPEQVLQSMPRAQSAITLTGRLLVTRPSEGLYTNFVIDGVSVHPYCEFAPNVYLRVERVMARGAS